MKIIKQIPENEKCVARIVIQITKTKTPYNINQYNSITKLIC